MHSALRLRACTLMTGRHERGGAQPRGLPQRARGERDHQVHEAWQVRVPLRAARGRRHGRHCDRGVGTGYAVADPGGRMRAPALPAP